MGIPFLSFLFCLLLIFRSNHFGVPVSSPACFPKTILQSFRSRTQSAMALNLQRSHHTAILLTYAHRSRWSIGHLRSLAIALCSGLLWSFRTSWSLAISALLQCLASNCCEAGLSCGFEVRAWRVVLAAGFLRVCPIQPHFLRSICLSGNIETSQLLHF